MTTITLPAKKTIAAQIVTASTPFSYSALEKAIATEAKAAARLIHKHMLNTKTSIFEIGRELRAIKEKMKHGEFGKWIAAEFDMSNRTAQRYMNVAERFDGKQELMKALSVNVIHALAAPSTPAGFTDMKLLEIAEGDIPTVKQISAEIAEAKNDVEEPKPAKAAKPLAKPLTEEQAAAKAVAMLQKRLGPSFSKFMELFKQTGPYHFMQALDDAAGEDEAA